MSLICWDYNDTIVGWDDKRQDVVRPNFKQVVEASKSKGYTHVVTSTLVGTHVESYLKGFGLDTVVERVFGNRRDASSSAKSYADVIKEFQIEPKSAPNNVVVIGDKMHDHPSDLENVVFIMNPLGHKTDAQIVFTLLEDLRAGTDSFYQGFLRLKTKDFDLKDECGFHYHGQKSIQNYVAVVLSIFNGCPWQTPTLLLVPKEEAKQFSGFEA